MDRKKLVWIFMAIGSTVGGYLPSFWDSNIFSVWGIVLGGIGGILGIYFGWKFGE